MSNLKNYIKIEIDKGVLQEPFSIRQLRNIFDKNGTSTIGENRYETKYIGTTLANHSTGPGDRIGESIKRGGEKLFIKDKKRGFYSLAL